MKCYFCKKDLDINNKIMYHDRCQYCGMPLHICYNCKFYSENVYHQCRETETEFVKYKEKQNYCDYFNRDEKNLDNESASKIDLNSLFSA